jgi:hypothetical protein
VFNLFGGEISWMRKRQVVVALSTTEVDYMASTHSSKEAVRLQRLCSGIRLVQKVVRIHCDSQSAIFWQRTWLIIQIQSILIFIITL